MSIYNSFGYLCNEPIEVNGIGYIKFPTLRDIRHITYDAFLVYRNLLSCSISDFLKMCDFKEDTIKTDGSRQYPTSLYKLLVFNNADIVGSMISFFVIGKVLFNSDTMKFEIYNCGDVNQKPIGYVGEDNFDYFRMCAQYVLGIKTPESEETPKFKNNLAKKMFDKLKDFSEKHEKKQNEDYSLDNMIKKYCTHNKVGINILNVWDMTYYQFVCMFNEYCNGRQCDFNDMMAANTFSYKKATDYIPSKYIKRITNN